MYFVAIIVVLLAGIAILTQRGGSKDTPAPAPSTPASQCRSSENGTSSALPVRRSKRPGAKVLAIESEKTIILDQDDGYF